MTATTDARYWMRGGWNGESGRRPKRSCNARLPDWNRDSFDRAEDELLELGASYVFNPAYKAPKQGEREMPYEWYMIRTLDELTSYVIVTGDTFYDVIVMLPGWEGSYGAGVERIVAEAIGLDVFELEKEEADG